MIECFYGLFNYVNVFVVYFDSMYEYGTSYIKEERERGDSSTTFLQMLIHANDFLSLYKIED